MPLSSNNAVSMNRPHSHSPRARRDTYSGANPVARGPIRNQPSSGHAERRYLCPECHRPFSRYAHTILSFRILINTCRPSAVDAHMPTHTGERRKWLRNSGTVHVTKCRCHSILILYGTAYQCTYDGCPKSFTTKSNMRRHLQSHTAPLAYSDQSPARPSQYQ